MIEELVFSKIIFVSYLYNQPEKGKNKKRYSFLIRHLGLVFLHINNESHSTWCRKAW